MCILLIFYLESKKIYFSLTGFDAFSEYMLHRRGVLASSIIPIGAFIPTTEEAKRNDWPEIQLHLIPAMAPDAPFFKEKINLADDVWNDYISHLKHKKGVTVSYALLRPKSRFVEYFFNTRI